MTNYSTPKNVLPKDFKWGFATASWQIEGGWDEDGRGPCVWDDFAAEPGNIMGGGTGHVTADSYHLWKDDIRLMKEMKVNSYRFSISWSRVIPLGGREDPVNKKGIQYYSDLIDGLIAAGIEPYVTLFHWDLPSELEKRYGGFSNLNQITQDFEFFARLCFKRFGDRVKHWITHNEPFIYTRNCSRGVKKDWNWELDTWRFPRALILAHAKAVQAYRSDFQPTQRGDIGLCLNCDWFEALGDGPAASQAASARIDIILGMYAEPVYLGKFPDSCKAIAGDRLEDFTPEEWKIIKGSSDCFYLNHYTSWWMTGEPITDHTAELYGRFVAVHSDQEGKIIGKPGHPGHLKMVPRGFRKILNYIQNKYLTPTGTPLIVSENGFAPKGEADKKLPDVLHNDDTIEYFAGYLEEMVKAMRDDNVNVIGYLAWSLLDNLEWAIGFDARYGSIYVDRDDNCKRYMKDSGPWLRDYFTNAMRKE